jgi:glycosyltransferase involved in cell wall biosynthesis
MCGKPIFVIPFAPTVSVIIPAYNTAQFVAEAVDSVLQQSYPPLEVIVVDDGSTDDTSAVLQRYVHDQRVRCIRQQNGGAGKARNLGVQHAVGELIAFLDSDDLWVAQKLALQVPLFANPYVAVVYSDREDIDERGEAVSAPALEFHRGDGLAGQLLVRNFVPMSSAVVRRSAYDEAGGFDPTLARSEDLDFWLRVALRHGFDYVRQPLVRHRRRSNQLTANRLKVYEASLLIQERFLRSYPTAVSRRDRNRGWSKRYSGRGKAWARSGNRSKAFADFLRALRYDPLNMGTMKEVIKLVVRPDRAISK